MRIGGRAIGAGQPPYVIAEIGVNHDGRVDRAIQLVRAAAEARADAVKFQFFETDRLLSRAAKLAQYQAKAGETDPITMLRRLELPISELGRAAEEAHRLGLHAILSVFSVELVAAARGVAWDAYKTASPDIVNRPLLRALAGTAAPLIVSTGASELSEIDRAIAWVGLEADRLAVLQCVSSYPTSTEHASIGGVAYLVEHLRHASIAVGYSDHTVEVDSGALAVAHGASLLERHLTHDRCAQGPDHAMSLDPTGFGEYAALARQRWRLGESTAETDPHAAASVAARVGRFEKRVLIVEQEVRRLCRQSIVATRRLPRGHTVVAADITIKRPGTGLPPFEMERVIGSTVAEDIDADMPINAACLAAFRSSTRASASLKTPAAA